MLSPRAPSARIPLHSSPELSCFVHGFWAVPPVTPPPTHSLHSSINVILGAHNIRKHESTQQFTPVTKAIRHPDCNPKYIFNDIMLLQVRPSIHWFLHTLFLGILHPL